MSGISLGGFLRSIFGISDSPTLGFGEQSGNGCESKQQNAAANLFPERPATKPVQHTSIVWMSGRLQMRPAVTPRAYPLND
jgi:hypothetical protein